jgi:hypothetical protein
MFALLRRAKGHGYLDTSKAKITPVSIAAEKCTCIELSPSFYMFMEIMGGEEVDMALCCRLDI